MTLLLGLDHRQVCDVGVFARLRNLRRSACSFTDDRGSAGRDTGGSRPRIASSASALGAGGDGRDAFRRARRSVTAIVFSLELTHCLPASAALDARLYRGSCRHVADHAAIYPDGKVKPPGLSPDQRVRCGSAGDGKCDGSDVRTLHDSVRRGSSQPGELRLHETGLPDIFAFADETCRGVAETMATTGVSAMPVVDRSTKRFVAK